MHAIELEKLKFPIGKFNKPTQITNSVIAVWINDISMFPAKLASVVCQLTDEQLDTNYRPNGWTIRQVVHHLADSHMNSFIRLKLALTESEPNVKPYHEDRWAELIDGKSMPIKASLIILEGIHERWTMILRNLTNIERKKKLIHPEHDQKIIIEENIGFYAWHCNHHLAHIVETKKFYNW